MKTLRISDEDHEKLTSVLGRLMAETGKMKTYSDAIEAMLSKSVMLSPESIDEVDSFIRDNAQLGYTTKEEFIQDAIRCKLTSLLEEKTDCSKKTKKGNGPDISRRSRSFPLNYSHVSQRARAYNWRY